MEPSYAVRRFTTYAQRGDRRCFEVYNVATGECASFPGTKRECERYAKEKNTASIAKATGG